MKAIRYLEAAKADEVVEQLRVEGYEVETSPDRPEPGYDIVAEKPGRRIAVAVRARQSLREFPAGVKKFREKLDDRDVEAFRLVIVNPPHETNVEIQGVDDRLFEYLRDHLPGSLRDLSSGTTVTGVEQVDFDSVSIDRHGIKIAGDGVVTVELAPGDGESRDGVDWGEDFPLRFAIRLDHNLDRVGDPTIEIDTSSFFYE